VTIRRFAFLPLMVFAFAFVACGGDDGGSGSDGGTQDPAALESESWILTQMRTEGGQTEIDDVAVSAQFDGTTISGNSGCNSYHASYEATGNEISFGPISGTLMACPEPENSTEARYLQLLDGIATFEVTGRSMSMNDQDGTPVLQFSQG
jgi:heat shock protein HslJ